MTKWEKDDSLKIKRKGTFVAERNQAGKLVLNKVTKQIKAHLWMKKYILECKKGPVFKANIYQTNIFFQMESYYSVRQKHNNKYFFQLHFTLVYYCNSEIY